MLILLGLENFKIKKELISLFLVPGRGKGVRMDYEALSWWNFKTENQQTSLIGFTLDLYLLSPKSYSTVRKDHEAVPQYATKVKNQNISIPDPRVTCRQKSTELLFVLVTSSTHWRS